MGDGNSTSMSVAPKVLIDLKAIMNILPHRDPMLFLDRIMSISEDGLSAVAELDVAEKHCAGHFPENLIFPGCHIPEAMAQVAGLLFLTRHLPSQFSIGVITQYSLVIHASIVPGDVLRLRVFIQEPKTRLGIAIGYFQAEALVGGRKVATVTAAKLVAKEK